MKFEFRWKKISRRERKKIQKKCDEFAAKNCNLLKLFDSHILQHFPMQLNDEFYQIFQIDSLFRVKSECVIILSIQWIYLFRRYFFATIFFSNPLKMSLITVTSTFWNFFPLLSKRVRDKERERKRHRISFKYIPRVPLD